MNAVIYSRVSTEDQDNARQIAELRGYAKYRKFKIVQVFEEKITGASKASERTEFSKLLALIEKEKIDCLLVWELSRIGRSMLDVLKTIDLFSEKRINIYTKKENINTLDEKGNKSPMISILISVLSGFAEMERETIKQRSISGIRANVANGGAGTSAVKAYGYKKVEKKLLIDDDEAKVIKLIYSKYLSGLGSQQIANYLNRLHIPTRFNKLYPNHTIKQKHGFLKKGKDYKWKTGTIYGLLTNSIYMGERKHKGEIFKIEPIIEKDTFEKVQKLLSSNYNKKGKHTKYDNPLKDILICGKCGRSYFMHKRHDNRDSAYKCLSKTYLEYCGNPSIGIDRLVNSLFLVCQPIINSEASLDPKNKNHQIREQIANKQILVANVESEISNLNSKLNNLIKLNLAGQLTIKQFTGFKSELSETLEKQEEKLSVLKGELSKLNSIGNKTNPVITQYSKEIFSTYIKDAVEYVKIYAADIEQFREAFPSLQDTAVLVEVKSSLCWLNGIAISYWYLISQRSNNIAYIEGNPQGKYSLKHFNSMDEIDPSKFIDLNPSNPAMPNKPSINLANFKKAFKPLVQKEGKRLAKMIG